MEMNKMPDTTGISNAISGLKNTVGESMDNFSSKLSVNAGSEYLQSNSAVAKFVFLIFALIVFLILMNLGIALIGYFLQPAKSPFLVNGMISGNANVHITQDPKNTGSIPIFRSNNQDKGIEFTWSTWLYIADVDTTSSDAALTYRHIFNKGNSDYDKTSGIATVNNGPGLYLAKESNILRVVMDTVDPADKNTVIDISNVPLKKWVHVAIRLQNKIVDVYINGTISARLNLINVPKQNYNDVYIGYNGGFPGSLSDLRYNDYALNVFQINNMVMMGPNTKSSELATNVTAATGDYSYLSGSWYSSKQS